VTKISQDVHMTAQTILNFRLTQLYHSGRTPLVWRQKQGT